MNQDFRNDHGPAQSDNETASTGLPADQPSRREFLVENVTMGAIGALAGVGALATAATAVAQSPTRVAAPQVPVPSRIAAPIAVPGRRVVTLNVKLPANVDLKTNIERVPGTVLALDSPDPGQDARTLVMDLTSSKTQDWLKPKKGSFSVSGTNCCCVRG